MTYFVTENYLKQKTPITENVSASDLMPFIEQVANGWIQNILGTYFFNYLLGKYNAETLAGLEIDLVNKIKPAIAWRAASECAISLTYQLKNKGLQKQNGDNSESVDLEEAKFVMRHYEQKAEFYEAAVRRYLEINKDEFPKFTSKENRDSELAPQQKDNFNGDMFFI